MSGGSDVTPLEHEKPVRLQYQAGTERSRAEASVAGRAVGGAFCFLFAVLAWWIWAEVTRGRFYPGGIMSPSVLISIAGSVFCLLVALGVVRVGREGRRREEVGRMGGGLLVEIGKGDAP